MGVQSTLDIRIRALIQGLAEVEAMATGLKNVTSAATGTQGAGDGLSELGAKADKAAQDVAELGTLWEQVTKDLDSLADTVVSAGNDLSGLGDKAETAASDVSKLQGAAAKAGSEAQALGTKAGAGKSGVDALGAGLKDVATKADGTFTSVKKVGDGAQKAGDDARKGGGGVRDFGKEVDDLKKGTEQLAGYLKAAAVSFVAFLAVKGAKEMADTAARAETLGVTLDVVGRNAGYSSEQLGKYEEELRKAGITTSVSREALTKMIQSGIELNAVNEQGISKAKELARAAQDLAVVTGENSSETLQRLITNISQLDTMGLRFQGIIVNTDEAYSKFAATIGKTADQLTQQQRVQAFANATLDEAAKLTGAYEKSMETVGKKVQSLTRYQEEAAGAIGNSLLPAYGAIVDAATDLLKVLTDVANEVNRSGELAAGLESAVQSVVGPLSGLLQEVISTVAELVPTLMIVLNVAAELVGGFFDAGTAILQTGNDFNVFKTVLEAVGLVIAAVQDGLTVITTVLAGVGLGFLRLAQYATQAVAAVSDFFGFEEASKAANSAAESLKAQADSTQAAIERNVQSFMDGNSAIERYGQALQKNAADVRAASASQSEAFKETDKKITELTSKIRQGQLTSAEAASVIGKLREEIKTMGGAGELTKKQVGELGTRLSRLAAEDGQKALKAITDLGLATQKIGKFEFLGEMNKAFGEVNTSLSQLATNIKVTDDQFSQAFSKGVDTAKSVADIGTLTNILRDAKKAGKDTSGEMVLLGQQFRKVFDEELKTARSQEEIDLLRKKVVALKDTYPELASQASIALQDIAKKTANAGLSTLELAKQATEVARARNQVLQSSLAIDNASLAVNQRARALDDARLALGKENTAVNRAKVELAQAELNLARAQEAQARAKMATEIASLNALIAKQKELQTLKAAEQGKASEEQVAAAKAAAAAAERELEVKQQQQIVQDGVVATQQQQVSELQDAVAVQQALVDKIKEQADAAGKVGGQATVVQTKFDSLYQTVEGLGGQFKDMGLDLAAANENAQDLISTWFKQRIVNIDEDWLGIARLNERMKELRETNAELNTEAERVAEAYKRTKDELAGIEDAHANIGYELEDTLEGAVNLRQAYADMKRDAQEVAKSAKEAADSFIRSNRSISEELLSAQGREEEAIKARMEGRKAELKIQYELLKVQLQIAIATAEAAGIDTQGLKNSLADAAASYSKALAELSQLEKIALEKQAKQREEAKQKAEDSGEEDKKKADKTAKETGGSGGAGSGRGGSGGVAQDLLDAVNQGGGGMPTPSPQLIAQLGGGGGGLTPVPEKTVRVQFENGKKRVSATINESDEAAFLSMLQQAKGVS